MDDEIEDPADTFDDAVAHGDRNMLLAQHAYEESESDKTVAWAAVAVARANYFQTRALAFYQFAMLIKEDE